MLRSRMGSSALAVAAIAVAMTGLTVPAHAADVVELSGQAGAAWFDDSGPVGVVSTTPGSQITAQVVGDVVRLSLWDDAAPARVYAQLDLERGVPDGQVGVRQLVAHDGSVCANGFSTVVRSAQYDTDGVPEVLDMSVRTGCPGLAVAELRIGTAAHFGLVVAEAGRLSALPGQDATRTLTVANLGPWQVTIGSAAVDTPLGQLDVTGCEGTDLDPGQDCELDVTYHGSAEPGTARTFTVNIPVTSDQGVELQPAITFLTARTARLPSPGDVRLMDLDGDRYLIWFPPRDDGGFPITGWRIRRVSDDTTTEVPYATRYLAVPDAADDEWYQVSAITDWGIGASASNPRYVGYSSRLDIGVGQVEDGSGRRLPGAWISSPEGLQLPLAVDGHEYTTPAVDPVGRIVVLSRAATAGAGQDDWDLWETGLTADAPLVHTTDLPGQETDAQFSPDGKTIAFTYRSTPTAPPEVWTVPVNPGDTPAVATTPTRRMIGASHPSWLSATDLVVADERTATSPLLRVRLTGTSATTVGSYAGTAGGRQPTVGWDGRDVAYVTVAGRPMRLHLASGTVAAEQLTPAAPAGVRFGSPQFLLDGNVVWTQATLGQVLGVRFSRPSSVGQAYTELAPVPRASAAPTVSVPSAPGVVRPGVAYPVSVDDELLRSLTVTCRVDGGPVVRCDGGVPTTGLADGGHRVTVTATGPSGTTAGSGSFRVDSKPPTAATIVMPKRSRDERVTVAVTASDPSGIASFEGRQRVRNLGSTFTRWRPAGPLHGSILMLEPGQTRCLSARARDVAGNLGPWGPQRCVTRMLDESHMRHSSGWRLVSIPTAAGKAARQARQKGETLRSRAPVGPGRVVLVAQQCPRCGAVDVLVGKRLVAHLDLRSGPVRWRDHRIAIHRTGLLRVVTTSKKRVTVDGFYPLP